MLRGGWTCWASSSGEAGTSGPTEFPHLGHRSLRSPQRGHLPSLESPTPWLMAIYWCWLSVRGFS